MIVLQILIAVIAAIGLGFILSDVFKIPKYPVSKAITTLGKRQKKKTNPLDIWLGDLANWIAGKLKLNEYKRLQLKADLDSADMTVSPEQYVANAIVKALFIGIFAIPFLFFAPILSLLIAVIAVVIYFTEYKKVGKIIRGKRQRIEYELPRLVSNIDKTLVHSRDVLGILDSYREHAGEDLRRELDITVADMRSGNYEVGETYIDVAITVMIVAFVLVFAVNMVSIVALNQNMKTMADQIIDYATTNGTTDINDYVETLRTKTGIGFSCSFAGTDYLTGQKVQLGDIIECRLTYSVSILGFGEAVFPVTVTASAHGISQVYWK